MTIWNVSAIYGDDNKARYTAFPYSLKGVVTSYLGLSKNRDFKGLFKFFKNSRLTEESAKKLANKKQKEASLTLFKGN